MMSTTTRFEQRGRGDVVSSYAAAPTRTVSVGGVDFAYRELGPTTGVPVVFLTHLAAVLDNWDPRVVDGIAAQHHVITFDNRGVGASGGSTPKTIEAMAHDAVAFIRALGLERVDLLGFSMGGMIAQLIAAEEPQLVRRVILAGTGPAGGVGHHEGDPALALRHGAWAAHLAGPEAVPILHPDAVGPSSGQGVPGPLEGAHRRPRQADLAAVLRGSAQGHPPLGPAAAGGLVRDPPAGPRRQRRERPDGAHQQLASTWPGAFRTQSWSSIPTPATAASSSSSSSSSRRRSPSSMSNPQERSCPALAHLQSNLASSGTDRSRQPTTRP